MTRENYYGPSHSSYNYKCTTQSWIASVVKITWHNYVTTQTTNIIFLLQGRNFKKKMIQQSLQHFPHLKYHVSTLQCSENSHGPIGPWSCQIIQNYLIIRPHLFVSQSFSQTRNYAWHKCVHLRFIFSFRESLWNLKALCH